MLGPPRRGCCFCRTGVGKTELGATAELVFGDERAFARFDMSEYAQEHAAERLTHANACVITKRRSSSPTG